MKRISGAAINSLKEALTNIYWYKANLISFLKNSLRNPGILSRIDYGAKKRDMVTSLVDYMAAHQDVYQSDLLNLMTETIKLEDFTHLEQLEDGAIKAKRAKGSVAALKALVAGYQELIDEEKGLDAARRAEYEASLKNKGVREKLSELKVQYFGFFTMGVQERGYALEKMMKELFELFDLDPKASFKISGEQIDGAFSFDATDYIFECKWQTELVNASILDAFKGKLSRKLDNTLGLFLSINGYSPDAIELHSSTRGMAILMDGQDLMAVLEARINLDELLLRKRRHASQTGNIYLKIQDII